MARRRSGRAWAGMAALALAGALPAAPAMAQAQAQARERLGLVVSGGVSEGSYQAGVTYALMKYLVLHRQNGEGYPATLAGAQRTSNPAPGLGSNAVPDFVVAAGSSAGNINSFLAALTWCAADSKRLAPRENLFWDSWVNVGWDKLSPSDPRGDAYKKLFADSLSTGDFRKLDPKTYSGQWTDDQSVYTADDGLVTRSAFAAVQANLRQRLEGTDYRDCLVRVGLTATRARAGTLFLGQDKAVDVRADRFVVPLDVQTTPGAPAVVHNAERADMSRVGLSLALPVDASKGGSVPFASVLTLVEASSAFPIAFGPVPLSHCRLPGDLDTEPAADVGCAPGWVGTKAPFIDGGIFDNQPFGLAYRLAAGGGQVPILFYVDVSPVRHEVVNRDGAQAKNGLELVLQILGARISEARGYENLAAATEQAVRMRSVTMTPGDTAQRGRNYTSLRDKLTNDRAPQLSSRFFPIVGNRLVDAFGAFMHPSFRVHDYFVGVYDGIFTIAQALELSADELKAPVSDRRAPTTKTFESVADALVGGDADLRAFMQHLFDYERFWAGVAGSTDEGTDRCRVPPVHPASRDTDREDAHVAQVFEVLCGFDDKARDLDHQGDVVGLGRHLAKTSGFLAIVDKLPDSFIGDENGWGFATEDRLVRRAIDVERAAHRQDGTPRTAEYGALVSRYFAAAGFERDDEILDLDPSSVARISGGAWGPGRLFWHLFPYYLAWDSVHSRVSAGWAPKLRFRLGDTSLYVPLGADVGLYTHAQGRPVDDGTPTAYEIRATPFGFGWDPKGRMFDDVQLAATVSSPLDHPTMWRSSGLELAAHPFGSKFRVSVGVPQALWSRDGLPGLSSRLSAWFFSIGLADLNGSLYWAARSIYGVANPHACEEFCDGATN